MKFSIITVAYNSETTIGATIESVLRQDYADIEYIIVDGKSTDNTVGIACKYIENFSGKLKIISEPDSGLYDAMNKGIRLSTGDIIGILNSDDCLATTTTVSKIASSIDAETDGVYGDVNVISRRGGSKVIRTISSKRFKPYMIRFGIAPPHPSFYIRRESYCKIGGYKSDYKISADFDLIVRMIRGGIRLKRLEECIVTMRNGGTSARGIRARLTSIRELKRACSENGIRTNTLLILSRFIYKAREFNLRNIITHGS